MIASVIVDIKAKQVNRSFDYLVPPHLENVIKVGYRVRVVFGKRVLVGFVVELKNTTTFKKSLKPISDLVDVYPVLNEEFIELAKFIASNNFSYYAVALQTMIPTALKIKYQKVAKADIIPEELKNIFNGRKEVIVDNRPLDEQKLIYEAYEKGLVELDTKFKKNRNEKMMEYIYVLDETIKPSSKQGQLLLDTLLEIGEPIPVNVLVEDSGFSKAVIKTLISKGIAGSYKKEVLPENECIITDKLTHTLNESQQNCFDSVNLESNDTYLLHGVTGSGKTLVYIKWIEEVLKKGKEALMLVPEISLTPQITAIFKGYFGDDVAILHSRLTVSEKYNAWKKILNKEVKIVVGARSAIFAPLSNLGIIIVDEEHENSYIQENNPKYNALEIASIRAKTHNCPLILGSATPNVNDYYKAINGEYILLNMPIRANNKELPKKTIVDMVLELKRGNKSVFSQTLKEKIMDTYNKKEQSILFLNRRGYSSFVMCRNCGEVIECPHCDVSLTYHASTNMLKCHHCGFSRPNVSSCPKCNSSRIRFVGSGTEKILEELNNMLPEARVLKMDMDTVSKTSDYEEIFSTFKNHEADILVGTQMITKGLDFADVTLVGVLNADLALHYPSYDATMTAYNLIEQVSGRAGRGEKSGEVIIQTYKPDHFVIKTAYNNDYDAFFKKEIDNRKINNMPPFSSVIEIMVTSENATRAYEEAKNIIYALNSVKIDSEILGPAEALPFKLNDIFRFTVQVKAKEDIVIEKIKEIYPMYQNINDVDLKITRM